MEVTTYILNWGKKGGKSCILQISDTPANIKAVLCEVLAAEILMPTWGPLPPPHVVYPFLEPGLVLQGKTMQKENNKGY